MTPDDDLEVRREWARLGELTQREEAERREAEAREVREARRQEALWAASFEPPAPGLAHVRARPRKCPRASSASESRAGQDRRGACPPRDQRIEALERQLANLEAERMAVEPRRHSTTARMSSRSSAWLRKKRPRPSGDKARPKFSRGAPGRGL